MLKKENVKKEEDVVEFDELEDAPKAEEKKKPAKRASKKKETTAEESKKDDVLEVKVEETKLPEIKEEKPAEKVENKPKAEEKPVQKVETPAEAKQAVEPSKIADFGIKSDDVVAQDERNELAKKEKIYRQLLAFKDSKEPLWATISASEYNYDKNGKKNMVGAICYWNGQRIVIPDAWFFTKDTVYPKGYETKSKEEQLEDRQLMISREIGARVCFTIEGIGKSDKGYDIMGNRLDALKRLQDYYFYHKIYKDSKVEVHKGDLTKARVLSVRSYQVLVECLGVETYIDAFNLSNDAVDSCRDVVAPGDVIDVRIRKLHLNEDNPEKGVYLTVSGRIDITPEDLEKMRVDSCYSGFIKGFNKTNNCYTVRLKNGVNASVLKQNVYKNLSLVRNDAVVVRVTKKEDEFVKGLIIAKI